MVEFDYLDAEFKDLRCIAMFNHVKIDADAGWSKAFLTGTPLT